MKIGYLVHDLDDAAVHRRVRMLQRFADVVVLGFHRSDRPQPAFAGVQPIDLGRTLDARFVHRTLAVLRAAVSSAAWRDQLAGVSVLIARQLEMLTLAALVRRAVVPDAPLVYECLDIHRLMLARNPVGIALRAVEGLLLRRSQLLVVSSPAFLTRHFARYGASAPAPLLLENKVMDADLAPGTLQRITTLRSGGPPDGPPWRIGWFGVIRCRRSLHLLAELTRHLPGRVEVVIRGRPKRDVIPEFDAVVENTPGIRFLGAYDRHTQLADIYGDVHFTWAIDYFEAGANSDWLLPNRLYEGALYGAVPIALNSVETGRWLESHQCGIRLEDRQGADPQAALHDYFSALDASTYATARQCLAQLPPSTFLDDQSACDRFGGVLHSLIRSNNND